MMKLFSLITFLLIVFLFPFPVAAQMDHMGNGEMTTTDNDVTGILQVSPQMPTAQQTVTLMFTINDQAHQFHIDQCDCEVTIAVPGKLPYTQKITTPAAATGGLYSVMVPFTFPRGDTYTISFTGTPKTPEAFQSFTLTWQLQVDPVKNEIQTLKTPKNQAQTNMLPIALAVMLLFLIVGVFVYKKKFS